MATPAKQKKHLLTREGLSEIQEELRHLKEERRIEIAERLKEAISYGDLSENSEYDDARTAQAEVEARIQELEEIVKNHELIETSPAATKATRKRTASVGSVVHIKNVTEGAENSEVEVFRIVGATESDILNKKLSNESPVGSALVGKEVGSIVRGRAPSGKFEYEIITIE